MPAVFDCFTFFNELDLLELRLTELDSVVDHFVIVESEETFTGNPKPFILEENYGRFARFHAKITYMKMARQPPSTGKWARQFNQRNKLIEGLDRAAPDDIVLLSDLDEIVSADVVARIRQAPPADGEVFCLALRHFRYYLNLELPDPWIRSSPRAVRCRSLASMQGLRGVGPRHASAPRDLIRWFKAAIKMRGPVKRTTIPNAGWHFSWLGGIDRVAEKGASISGGRKIPKDMDSRENARLKIQNGLSKFSIREIDDGFPRTLIENRDTFDKYLTQKA